eukprot:1139918-Pelagomonas_calceolata.AAC.3
MKGVFSLPIYLAVRTGARHFGSGAQKQLALSQPTSAGRSADLRPSGRVKWGARQQACNGPVAFQKAPVSGPCSLASL